MARHVRGVGTDFVLELVEDSGSILVHEHLRIRVAAHRLRKLGITHTHATHVKSRLADRFHLWLTWSADPFSPPAAECNSARQLKASPYKHPARQQPRRHDQ